MKNYFFGTDAVLASFFVNVFFLQSMVQKVREGMEILNGNLLRV